MDSVILLQEVQHFLGLASATFRLERDNDFNRVSAQSNKKQSHTYTFNSKSHSDEPPVEVQRLVWGFSCILMGLLLVGHSLCFQDFSYQTANISPADLIKWKNQLDNIQLCSSEPQSIPDCAARDSLCFQRAAATLWWWNTKENQMEISSKQSSK